MSNIKLYLLPTYRDLYYAHDGVCELAQEYLRSARQILHSTETSTERGDVATAVAAEQTLIQLDREIDRLAPASLKGAISNAVRASGHLVRWASNVHRLRLRMMS